MDAASAPIYLVTRRIVAGEGDRESKVFAQVRKLL
jgi:hypothetical protein